MRNMSFALTTPQMRDRSKMVTRRLGWEDLEPGDVVMAVVKGMGLGKGGKVEHIHPIKIVNVRREELRMIRLERNGTRREGFPRLTPAEFVNMFCAHNGCKPSTVITRIEFKHL